MDDIFVCAQSSPYGAAEARHIYHIMWRLWFYDVIYDNTCVTKNKFFTNKRLWDWSPSLCREARAAVVVCVCSCSVLQFPTM